MRSEIRTSLESSGIKSNPLYLIKDVNLTPIQWSSTLVLREAQHVLDVSRLPYTCVK